jgi:hypothetical protein
LPDHAAGGIADRQRELLGEMVGERPLDRNEGFEIVVAVLAAGGAGAGPFGIARGHLGDGARGDRIGLVESIGEGRIASIVGDGTRFAGVIALPVDAAGLGSRRAITLGPGLGSRRRGVTLAVPGALEQGIALELGLHVGGEVQIGELQQLDGLHQLRRHDERVALPDFKSLGERHAVCLTGPSLAYPVLQPVYTSSARLS